MTKTNHGDDYLKERRTKTELARINGELKRLKARVAALENRKATLLAELEKYGATAQGCTGAVS